MMNRKKNKKKQKNSSQNSSTRVRQTPLTPETLRRDLSDPARLQHAMDHLTELIRREPGLQPLRFPAEKLMTALDELAETSAEELQAMSDPLAQRIAIITHAVEPLITRKFSDLVEKTLMSFLERTKNVPRDFRAASAGLYFLEIHNRQGSEPGANPLWNILFDISYEEAMESSGNAVATARTPAGASPASGAAATFGDFFDLDEQDLTEDDQNTLGDALELIESGKVELGFSLDTILLGLRAFADTTMTDPDIIIRALLDTFRREVGMQEWNDMIWGLEYATEKLDGESRRQFETVLEAVRRFPARDNPALFALYFRSVTDSHRFIKPDEVTFAEAIVAQPGAVEPVMDYGRFLLTGEAPRRALNVFMAATIIDPSDEMARFAAGVACRLSGSCREARLHWDRAARLWRGYLPEHHPNIQLVRELLELDDIADLPQKAYNFLLLNEELSTEE